MKKALILGCSHAAGSELGNDAFARAHSYPALVAQMLGYDAVNLAIPGGSNDAMFRIFLEHMHECDIVIAAWSGYNRSEIIYKDSWIAMGPHVSAPRDLEQWYTQWCLYSADDRLGRLNKIKNVVALNSLSPVPVINCESFWPVWDYTWPQNQIWPLAKKENFWDWSNRANYQRTSSGHFEITAHQEYAKLIANNLKL